MTTKIATMAGKLVVVSGLALMLSISSLVQAEQAGKENYFVQHPGPVGGHTGVDVHDPYAPVDLGPVLVVSGFTATEITGGWDTPPTPGQPGKPF